MFNRFRRKPKPAPAIEPVVTIAEWAAPAVAAHEVSERVATEQPSAPGIRVAYTVGDELHTPGQYRSVLEREWRRLMGGASGVSDQALTELFRTAVPAFVCANFHANAVAEVPQAITDPSGSELGSHPLTHFLETSAELYERIDKAQMLWGKAYLRKRYNRYGYPSALEWLYPHQVDQIKDHRGVIVGFRLLDTYETLPVEQVVFLPLFDPFDETDGLSPLEVAFNDANVVRNIVAYGSAFFFNRAMPDGMLTWEDEISTEEFKAAQKEWRVNMRGVTKQHRTIVMPPGAKFVPFAANNKDLALTELSDSAKQHIAAAFETPRELVGLGDVSDPLSLGKFQELYRVYIQFTIVRRVNKINLELNRQWLWRDFDPRNFYTLRADPMQMDLLTDVNADQVGMVNQLTGDTTWTFNEGREFLHYKPYDEGEYLVRNPVHLSTMNTDGTLMLNEYRKMQGLSVVPGGDVFNIGGKLIPQARLAEVAQAMADQIVTPTPEPGGFQDATPLAPVMEAVGLPSITSPAVGVSRRSQRHADADSGLLFAADFGGNQFVRYARRQLSQILTDAGITAEWVHDDDWRMALAAVDDWSQSDVSKMLRTLDMTDADKIDAWTAGYLVDSGNVYLAVEVSEGVGHFVSGVHTELRSAGLQTRRTDVLGIKLCATPDVSEDMLSGADVQRYPLVVNNVSLYMYGKNHHRWSLRARADDANWTELKRWRKVVKRKGREYDFDCDALDGHPVSDFVRWSLALDADATQVFGCAERMLKGALPVLLFKDGEPVEADENEEVFAALGESFRTVTTYRRSLRAAVRGLWNGALSVEQFTDSMELSIVRGFKQAWAEGIAEVGLSPADMTQAELNDLDKKTEEEFVFIPPFAEAVQAGSKANGGKQGPLMKRVELWVNRYRELKNFAKIRAADDLPLVWMLGATEEHCTSCLKFNGKIYRGSVWRRHLEPLDAMPQGRGLACNGYNCDCRLELSSGPVTPGRPPKP